MDLHLIHIACTCFITNPRNYLRLRCHYTHPHPLPRYKAAAATLPDCTGDVNEVLLLPPDYIIADSRNTLVVGIAERVEYNQSTFSNYE